MSTLWSPSSRRRLMMRSSSIIFPEPRMSTSFTASLPVFSSIGQSKRYGWLQHLRSCISTLFNRISFPPESQSCLLMISLYMVCCHSERAAKRMNSDLGGSEISTSCLRRRSKKGLRIWWSLLTTECCSSPFMTRSSTSDLEKSKSNHAWKESRSSKMSGSRKLSRDQSSVRLFCSGVPERSRRLHSVPPHKALSSLISLQFIFLRRWPSSMITNFQASGLSSFMSRITISYEVIITGGGVPFFERQCVPRSLALSSLEPW
mmetsp:Transcript_32485/g.69688  ORF Transcript_32485/g.69688 Transcript_32485/m.69688 type:complete len:261 (+) Transcript_32485:1182-1964(+)